MLTLLRCCAIVASMHCIVAQGADTVFELEPEYVYGKNRKPRLGYVQPEVFDPLSDRLYQSGYREFRAHRDSGRAKDVDAMTRVQKMGHILACADAWFWPFSRTAHKNEPAGHRDRDLAVDRQEAWLGDRHRVGQHRHALRCRA